MKAGREARIGDYWQIVARIVESRGRKLQRYPFFEDVWRAADEGKQLIIVRAPTGGGKTEAAATPFLGDLVSGARRWLSLIHILPTRSLVNAMRWRYAEAVGAIEIGNAVVAYEYGQLIGVRPYLDGDIVVTTYDTMLHRFYGVDLRAPHILGQVSKIMNSLLIMDEVQLLQDEYWYAMSLIPCHIKALLAWGAQIILMTATLPTAFMENLVKQVLEGVKDARPEEITEIRSSSRPARGRISLELVNDELPSSQDQLVKIIREHYPGEGSVLIIANTVEKAAAIYTSLLRSHLEKEMALKPVLLHSRLRQGVRKEVEWLLESKRGDEFILVATQVVEAGLDMDSTLLITEISPIDSLIQRIGRCGRRRNGMAIIYTRSEDALKVYPEPIVEKTRRVVSESSDLLAESPSDLEAAQILIDQVFDREKVDLLMRGDESARVVIGWIEKYWISEAVIDQWAAHNPPNQLLRPGLELQAYKPRSPEEYETLVRGGESRIGIEEFEKNLVRLGIRDVDIGRFTMPALLHKAGGTYYVIMKLVTEEWMDEVKLIPSRRPASSVDTRLLLDILEGRRVFLLNPEFYEELELDGIRSELGVVKPWKKMYGSA
ncbi:MAG: CRISPR-associated helicase Cas3' [Aigarchaeota archaeon]|nr:CRISPR-associated helicase Cas3' [Aigarchaeota archaeon]